MQSPNLALVAASNDAETFEITKPEHFGFSTCTEEGAENYKADLDPNWVPVLLPLHTLHTSKEIPARAGTFVGIYRPGYWEDPLGVVAGSKTYNPVNHTDSASAVASCGAKITPIGAKIDSWGHHVCHAFRLDTFANKDGSPHMVRGMPVTSVLNLVHDHTGTGAIYASVTIYLGRGRGTKVLGAVTKIRKIHKGEGKKHVGVGSNARWTDTVAALCEHVITAQVEIIDLLEKASKIQLTAEHAAEFRKNEIFVDSEEVTDEKTKEVTEVFSGTLLDVVTTHHESRRGPVGWGIWAKRLESDALTTLDEILNPDVNVTALQSALKKKVF